MLVLPSPKSQAKVRPVPLTFVTKLVAAATRVSPGVTMDGTVTGGCGGFAGVCGVSPPPPPPLDALSLLQAVSDRAASAAIRGRRSSNNYF